ncbi:hypothetical protein [Hydrogenophaga sp.]|uniref:hypothetical protein n=1 Tax=Hydrogenophaga sp. TaxID=1904254 RepID=UPI003566CFA0
MEKHAQLLRTRMAAAVAISCGLLACGGGSGDPARGGSADDVTLSGTAASGAPLAGAAIVVTDALGAEVQVCKDSTGLSVTCNTQPDGSYTLTIKAGAQAPLVLKATPVDGSMTQVSMVGEAKTATVNVTPITTLIAAALAASGNPYDLKGADFNADDLQAAVAEIVAALKPLLDAVGTTANPLTGVFQADGTGMDKALDVLDVRVVPDGGSTTVFAEIKLNGDGAAPASVVITAGGAPVVTNMDKVLPDALPADGLGPMLANLMGRMSACYNLPYNERVDTSTTPHTLKALACKSLFVGADPTTWKSNGFVVAPSDVANSSFNGMFSNRDTSGPSGARNELTFDQPVYELTRTGGSYNGDVVFTHHWKDRYGNEDWSQQVVRNEGGVFKLIGNQYDYDISLRPALQRWEFVDAASVGSSYMSTGYNARVGDRHDNTGKSLFDRVEVITPRGTKLSLWPSPALNRLTFKRANGVPSGSSHINLQWAYLDSLALGGRSSVGPSGKDLGEYGSGGVYARDAGGQLTQWSDTDIKAIPNQGRWRFDIFLAGNSGSTPDATQWHTSLTRIYTLGEARSIAWAAFNPTFLDQMRNKIDVNQGGVPITQSGFIDFQPSKAGDPDAYWNVPAGAMAPVYAGVATAFGGVYFNDGLSVFSKARTARVSCQKIDAADQHCTMHPDGTSTGEFAVGNVINNLDLWTRNSRNLELANHYNLYRRTP